jgi:uncharacterized protein (TIGR02996 family)
MTSPTPMSDETALRRAVVADPADDTVRLAYADWLDEHDKAVPAAYIRLAINEPAKANAFFRENSRHLDTWHGLVLFRGMKVGFDRGFVARLAGVRPRWWIGGRGDWLRKRHPITRVRFAESPRYETPLADPNARILVGDHRPVSTEAMDGEIHKERRRFRSRLTAPDLNENYRALCRARWPGVEFYLPGDPDDVQLADLETRVARGLI